MMKGKKSYLITLALLLAVSLTLSACGGKKDNSEASGNGSAKKPVELIWYTIGTPQKDVDRVMAEVSKYTAEKIGVTVKMNQIDWGDYSQKMQVMTASGTPMDIMFTSSWAFDYVQNARKGAFLPIDDLLKKQGQGIVKELDPAFLEGSKVDGHNYGVPANKELPAQVVWRFNKTLVDKYKLNIDNVSSLESLEPLLKTIKEKDPSIYGLAVDKTFGPYVPYDYIIEGMPMAVKVGDSGLKVVDILDTPEMQQTLKTMNKYYKAGYIPTEAATLNSLTDVQATGKWFTDKATNQPFADNLWSASLGYPIVSKAASPALIYNWSVMGSMQAISANSEYPEKAMEFLNLLNTDPVLRNMVDSGIEGVHYKKVGTDAMENLPESKNYDMPTFSLGNVMLTYRDKNDPENKWEEFKKFNASSEKAPLLGFNFDPTKVKTEIAAVQNVKEEFWASLMTGTVDPVKFIPQATKKFKAAGLDKIIAEAQSQVDAWKAASK
ncbi:ABC transporter substrate-binding protein [Paenibacillus baekrokdamisoli]|uniref:ABC transporter substrate-binding protein n=1 Tax=Paenibacillus baekrokdamisoli TaxID=1712516 RepID=A0A3G9JG48_9BACL|nr:ABC transporter substrate-binding protein [Paenibacillus baekrokdamisoli]MBB3071539.1 putative aldouronate transport system substrate-binding protein [Paenibacillus baekrokdamisoli]BBH21949.1 ABC transporter substrate-binding protein [Paenibacillus baekrokdamisoli]